MNAPFKVGDRVKKSDADRADSIPAYRALRGTVVEVSHRGSLRILWDCDRTPDFGFRDPSTLTLSGEP